MRRTCALLIALAILAAPGAAAQSEAQWWVTTADRTSLLSKQTPDLQFSAGPSSAIIGDPGMPTIAVDSSKTFQSIDGFGFALTGGSTDHLMKMSPDARHKLLRELFGAGPENIGVSYLRITIGASDLNDHVFSYDDLPDGQTDPNLDSFTLAEDDKNVVPILKEILTIDPSIKLLASPWSAPTWMKTNDNVKGGTLKEEDYPVYARYLAKYVAEMKSRGIHVDAITPQNEPNNANNTPSMLLSPGQELRLVKEDLGPVFRSAGIDAKIIVYDHNCDRPDYPLTILSDPDASKFVDGSGFHLYRGSITALSQVHDAFPDKNVYFTEQMVISIRGFNPSKPVADVLIGATRNWSRNVLLWNLAADSSFEPHTPNGGCPFCQGAVTIDGDDVERNVAYYAVAHFSKFVPPNSVRIDSSEPDGLPNVAFRTPEGKIVDIVANTVDTEQTFHIEYRGRLIQAALPPQSAATFVW